MKKLIVAALFMFTMGLSQSASALCTILCSCSVSTSSVSFGVYNPLSSSPHDSAGNVRVTCGGVLGLLVPYNIAINKGVYSTNFSPRQMASGVNRLSYDLYTSGAHTLIWGDGSGSTQVVPGSVTIVLLGGTFNDHAVYGRIPGSQSSVPPGGYSDTVTVTVIYN
jgi:spore coat protein U-like protein